MKKITVLSAVCLSAGLVACGGGDPKSASSKPDNLFPDGYVPPSSASSSSSSVSNIVNQTIPYHENFDAANNTRSFFSANYKSLNTDTSLPFYFATGGFLDELGNPSPTATSWITADANRKLRIGNGRLSLGQTKLEVNTTTADETVPTWGEFDLSKPYKVSFCVVEAGGASSSNFELYVDNNSTGGNNSIYGAGNASRILQMAVTNLVPGTRQEVVVPKAAGEKQIGRATSFFQIRVSSGGWAVIDDVVVEYAGEPHGFTLPACVAENSIAPQPETPPTTPAAPTIIAGDAELVASWASVGTGVTYEVAYNTVNDVASATAFSGNPVDGTSAQLSGLINGQEYFVWVKAKNVIGSSEYSPSASGTPVAPTGIDASKEWGFNSFEYSALVSGTSGTVAVTISETAYDADGLKIFLNNGTALRYRFDSNSWNYNGNSFRSSDSRVPAVGEVVAELRAYVGTPVVASRAATITFTVKQTGSGQAGKAVIVDQDNRVVSVTDIADSTITVDIPVALAEGHSTTELRAFYSREGTSSGGMDLIKLVKSYADSPISSSSSSSSEASSSVPASSSSAPSSEAARSSAPASSSEASSSVASSVDGGVTSSSSSSAASSGAALLSEDFATADTTNFFTNAYKAIPTDSSLPLYVATAGSTRVSFANGELSMNNARFTIGDKGGATAAGVQPNGSYDLTNAYRVKFTITAIAGTGNVQVYVDNNTTSAGSSIHSAIGSTASRLTQIAASSITTFPHEVVIESAVGTATSFFQIRADSAVTNLTIDNLTIEYQ
ncbi:MAG TPA: hypothetical protein DIW64_03270 [Cellvibrio sp.]|nr:hypothetical protein [Cellvibrio sp.]